MGVVARAERGAVEGIDGAGQLVELRDGPALCPSRHRSPAGRGGPD